MNPAALALGLLLLAPAAWACEPVPPADQRDGEDRPITIFLDGSFQDAARDDTWEGFSARPVRDIGGGRVGQVLEQSLGNCLIYQSLLVVDCTAAEALVVEGLPDRPETVPHSISLEASARQLQPPYGPLALTPDTTVADVATLARTQGWVFTTRVEELASARGAHNHFDPFMGCEIYYPGSAGAQW